MLCATIKKRIFLSHQAYDEKKNLWKQHDALNSYKETKLNAYKYEGNGCQEIRLN
jgi:hypothetical protein